MFKFKDALLLIVSFSSILAGVFLPDFGAHFQPYPIYCMMALLFFSFVSIRISAIVDSIRTSPFRLSYFVFSKLILLPVAVYAAFRYFLPEYAQAALLLSGISTGVSSPFFAALLYANGSLVLCMTVLSSILTPFTLPALVDIILGRYVQISFLAMTRLLCLTVFVPFALAEFLRRFLPALVEKLTKAQYPVSLVSFAITNLGIFSKYSNFLLGDPSTVLVALAVSVALAGIYFAAGILCSATRPLEDRLAIIISFAIPNNVLVLVFSSEFFSPLEPTVAALYTIPFFGLIVPMRIYGNRA